MQFEGREKENLEQIGREQVKIGEEVVKGCMHALPRRGAENKIWSKTKVLLESQEVREKKGKKMFKTL